MVNILHYSSLCLVENPLLLFSLFSPIWNYISTVTIFFRQNENPLHLNKNDKVRFSQQVRTVNTSSVRWFCKIIRFSKENGLYLVLYSRLFSYRTKFPSLIIFDFLTIIDCFVGVNHFSQTHVKVSQHLPTTLASGHSWTHHVVAAHLRVAATRNPVTVYRRVTSPISASPRTVAANRFTVRTQTQTSVEARNPTKSFWANRIAHVLP